MTTENRALSLAVTAVIMWIGARWAYLRIVSILDEEMDGD